MSHRIKRFAAFAIFALFYHFAAVDSILGFYRHQTDTKKTPKPPQQRQDKVYQMKDENWCPLPPSRGAKVVFLLGAADRGLGIFTVIEQKEWATGGPTRYPDIWVLIQPARIHRATRRCG